MNLKKLMLACIAGLTSFGVMAAPLVLGTTNTFVGTVGTLLKNSASDVSGWQYNGADLISSMDDASTIKSATALDLNTSGGELKFAFAPDGNGAAPLAVPTTGAYEYSVDTTFQFTKDWPTDLLASLQTSGAKTAVFAMANNADDDSQGAKLIIAQGGAYTNGISSAAGFAYVQLPAAIQTGTTYRITIRVKGVRDGEVSGTIGFPVTLFKVLVDGVEYPVYAFDGTTVGSQIGFSATETDLTVMGTGAGNWLMSACFNDVYVRTLNVNTAVDVMSSVSFQGTGTLDNMALATYIPPITANWTLDIVGSGVVSNETQEVTAGGIGSGTYTVYPATGYIFSSVATNGTPITVTAGAFTLDTATGLDTVTVTFKAVTAAPVVADIANIPEGQLDATAKGTLNGAIAGVTDGSTKFDAWATAKGVKIEDLTTAGIDNVVNAFLCNVGLTETTGLLAITEVTANGTTFTAKVYAGAISVSGGVMAVNGTPVAYAGTTLGGMEPAGVGDVSIGDKDGSDYVIITVTMPSGTSGFVKFAIE